MAVGTMLVSSVATLWGLRRSLMSACSGFLATAPGNAPLTSRLEKDLNLRGVFFSSLVLLIPMGFIYYHFSHHVPGTIAATIVMALTAFLFSAVGGWLVGIVGNSNQPVSGLTLSALLIAALVMLLVGVTGLAGIASALATAAIVCCAAALAGDMIQDLKIGQLLGGTPWKMELAEIISVIVVAFFLVAPIVILHEGNIAAGGLGIGDAKLPAPQAGLMAQLAVGIVGGEMPWGLIAIGVGFGIALLFMQVPAPMVIAVGMYLPFETSFAIFVGGGMKWIAEKLIARRGFSSDEKIAWEGRGTLIASGFIAGEALTGVFLTALVLVGIPSLTAFFFGRDELAILGSHGGWLSLIVFGVVGYGLIGMPLRKKRI